MVRRPRRTSVSILKMLRLGIAAGLLCGACAADPTARDESRIPVQTTATSSTVPTSTATVLTATSTVPETTTTVVPGPVDISIDDEPLTKHDIEWEQGASYVALRFFTPVSFVSPTTGWMSRGAGERWVSLVWTSPEDGAVVTLALLAFEQGSTRQEVADSISEIEGVDLVSDFTTVTMAGYDTISFDVFGQEKASALDDYKCTTQLGRWNWDSSGYPLVLFIDEAEDGWEYGLPACFRSRVWIVDSDPGPVTIVATPLDPERFEELVSRVEPLLESVVIGD